MCGIFGLLSVGSIADSSRRVNGAVSALRHRGPDDFGHKIFQYSEKSLLLGHVRLSIIDLSSAGHQPMLSSGERFCLIFNGEIYNYRELREELKVLGHTFASDTDTEVLLTAWREWGRACLPRLVGMFAFVVWDRDRGILTCVRDAFGIKPFFYAKEGNGFLFASELPAVKALKSEKVSLNWQRSYDYLVHGDYDSNEYTFIDGVLSLMPGHLMEVSLSSGIADEPVRWWSPRIEQTSSLSFSSAAEAVRECFLDGVRLHLRSDVPLGAALSGGIDSSAVVCAMRHVEPDMPINTFSYIAAGSVVSEEKWVDLINASVGAIEHKVVVDPQELATDLDDMIRVQGEPFGSTSIYAQYRVFKLAREHGVTVTLDGQGADEMLAGYSGYPGKRIKSLLDKRDLAGALSFAREWSKWPGRDIPHCLKSVVAECVDGPFYDILRRLNGMRRMPSWIDAGVIADAGVFTGYPRQRSPYDASGRMLASELAFSLTRRGLPSLLRHGDRNSMRFSVESRVPFLTLDMVNLLLSLPEEYLISAKGETKSIFRAAMRGIVPDVILDRRDKIGFSTPEQVWLVQLSSQVREWLSFDLELPFLNQAAMLEEFEKIISGKAPFSWQVWRWINFCRWYRNFFIE